MADRWDRERLPERDAEREYDPSYDRYQGNYDREGQRYGRERTWESRPAYDRDREWANREYGRGWERPEDRERYGRGREWDRDRGWTERAGDWLRSTFGDDRDRRERYDDRRREDWGKRGEASWERTNYGTPLGSATYESGRYAGRGPKNYRRSDERITEEVCERLTRHPDVDASDINVRVDNGVVTLTGNVDERRSKRIAEDLACEVWGVNDVRNDLRVQQYQGAQGYGTTSTGTGTSTPGSSPVSEPKTVTTGYRR